ncbi:MAG: methylated-DNA--[protein]-cysteine S-methyltransferase [Terriglobales bacterium]
MEQAWCESPVGRLWVAADEQGLRRIEFPPRKGQSGGRRAARETAAETAWFGAASPAARRILRATRRQLEEYFAGRRKHFDLPLAPEGTEFQLRVWAELRKIPWGETISYGELARRIGAPTAARAVGAANGANPIPIVIPCHRVIGSTGQLTGFGGGLETKARLLALEGAQGLLL